MLVEQSVGSNTNNELCHWLSIVSMSPQSHCGDEDGKKQTKKAFEFKLEKLFCINKANWVLAPVTTRQ